MGCCEFFEEEDLDPKQGHKKQENHFDEVDFFELFFKDEMGLFLSMYSLISLYQCVILNFKSMAFPSKSNVSQHSSKCLRLESYTRSG